MHCMTRLLVIQFYFIFQPDKNEFELMWARMLESHIVISYCKRNFFLWYTKNAVFVKKKRNSLVCNLLYIASSLFQRHFPVKTWTIHVFMLRISKMHIFCKFSLNVLPTTVNHPLYFFRLKKQHKRISDILTVNK